MPQHYAIWNLVDYSDESSSFKMYNGAITPTSISGYVTDLGTFRAALDGLTLGTLKTEQWVGDLTLLSNTLPTDPDAQRERKGLMTYIGDTTGKTYTATIPTIRTKDGSGGSLLLPGTDMYDLTKPLVSAVVSAFESIARTPDDDLETVTVQSIRLVGRNI